MTTISLKLPDTLDSRLAEEAQRRRTSKSAVVRECVEKVLLAPRKDRAASCLDLASDVESLSERARQALDAEMLEGLAATDAAVSVDETLDAGAIQEIAAWGLSRGRAI